MAAYADRVKLERHRNLSDAQIRQMSCQRTKARNAARKAENIKTKTSAKLGVLKPQTQLEKLDFRLGKNAGAKRERARLIVRIEERKGNKSNDKA